jgi:hypothetical protein
MTIACFAVACLLIRSYRRQQLTRYLAERV